MNSTEQHRRECEAREVMRKGKNQRQEYYEAVKKARGQSAVDDLIAEVKRQYGQGK